MTLEEDFEKTTCKRSRDQVSNINSNLTVARFWILCFIVSIASYLFAIPQTLQLASSMNSAADQPTVERSIHPNPMRQLRWHRPSYGFVKANFDAACSDTHRTGFSLIIRDVQGDLLFAACYKPLRKFNPTLAEASCFSYHQSHLLHDHRRF